MKNILLLSISSLLILHTALGQSTPKATINLMEKTATKMIQVDKEGVVHLDTLEGTLVIVPPDTLSLIPQYSVQFNSDTTKFFLTFDKQETRPHIYITRQNMDDNAIYLTFKKGQLISIGKDGRLTFNPGKSVAMVHPYIQIINKAPAAPDKPTVSAERDAQEILAFDDESISKFDFLSCPDTCKSCLQDGDIKKKFKCKGCDPEIIPSLANQVFLPPCTDGRKKAKAVSANYAILYDTRTKNAFPAPLIVKFKNRGKGYESFEVIKEDEFTPMAKEGIAIGLIRPPDSLYTLISIGVNDTLSNSNSFGKSFGAIGGIVGGGAASPVGDKATTDAATKSAVKTDDSLLHADQQLLKYVNGYDSTLSLEKKIGIYNNLSAYTLPFPGVELNRISTTTTLPSIRKKGNERLLADVEKMMDDVMYSLKNLYAQLENKKPVKPNEPKKDSLAIYRDSVNALQKQLSHKIDQVTLRVKLEGLYASLVKLNQSGDISLKERSYRVKIDCLKQQIGALLNIGASDDDSVFATALTNKVSSVIDKKYTNDFQSIIRKIQSEYAKAVKRAPTVGLFYFSQYVRVPKADSVNINIKKQGNSASVFNTTYAVQGGVKIDFSTGFFVNGINNVTYSLGQHTFRYKITADTILPNGTDSVMYRGIKDTTGNLIHTNSSKLNYSIGVMAHIYQRTTHDVNYGGVVGVMLDNNSKIIFSGGGSIMFRAGKNRIALVGGVALGQETRITDVNSKYLYDPKGQPDFKTYNSIYEMPRFYTGGNDISTYTRWKLSWFAGITYNISVN